MLWGGKPGRKREPETLSLLRRWFRFYSDEQRDYPELHAWKNCWLRTRIPEMALFQGIYTVMITKSGATSYCSCQSGEKRFTAEEAAQCNLSDESLPGEGFVLFVWRSSRVSANRRPTSLQGEQFFLSQPPKK
ncbi:uncharacterized protein LOC112349107 [Selaginella moellendorffii]|uniref:uncharacterized protein LOC112349107 n=1 Tax=Selaginella moellendorffii TaxID=88036 RepID=UPI000D1CD97D|nr:uncharacterized protein LOC112349107 [Selaginella moellendorffii]|eukprot:XP_024538660.1 uncharacterized protein LOC112349107 [Selaginella moellendorffii]